MTKFLITLFHCFFDHDLHIVIVLLARLETREHLFLWGYSGGIDPGCRLVKLIDIQGSDILKRICLVWINELGAQIKLASKSWDDRHVKPISSENFLIRFVALFTSYANKVSFKVLKSLGMVLSKGYGLCVTCVDVYLVIGVSAGD